MKARGEVIGFGILALVLGAVALEMILSLYSYPRWFAKGEVIQTRLDSQVGLIVRVVYELDGEPYLVRFPQTLGGYRDQWMSERELKRTKVKL